MTAMRSSAESPWAGLNPPYTMLKVEEIACLDVEALADADAHLYLWTTNRYLRMAHSVAEAWGFKPSQTLVWCKSPQGIGPGGAFSNTTEFVLFCRRGHLAYQDRIDTTWWQWDRGPHSVKPAAFLDVVERVSPGPYVELFARQPRLGWDAWGYGHEAEAIAGERAAITARREARFVMLTIDDRCPMTQCVHKTGIYRMVGRCLNCGTEPDPVPHHRGPRSPERTPQRRTLSGVRMLHGGHAAARHG